MLSCSSFFTVLSYVLFYKIPNSLLLRGQNTSCGIQQQEAGVTPEARRDRAAILRHDGAAPASGRVLAALRFLAVSVASACLSAAYPHARVTPEVKSPGKDDGFELFMATFTG